MNSIQPPLGAVKLPDGRWQFCVWAPKSQQVSLSLINNTGQTLITMEKAEMGYFRATVDDLPPDQHYRYGLDQGEFPDPASRYQPEGVHGPSQILDSHFEWHDGDWQGIALQDYVLYEAHVGTFSHEGTFEAMIPYLDYLVDLGITAIELLPINQFAGTRNWGYDGVFLFAVQHSYGGPEGLKRLVDACHQRGLAVVLDVVYNHLGPEGNYVGNFAPYTTERYRTPWGAAINFDDAYSDQVRAFFLENALMWIRDFHIDGLRLDAIHFIFDFSAQTFMSQLVDTVQRYQEESKRHIYLFAETDQNNANLVRPRIQCGQGMDAQWNDDFHHALRSFITGEKLAYYEGYGQLDDVVKAIREGFVFSGQYSTYRKRHHGSSSADIPPYRFVIFSQNHDQIGNHMPSQRFSHLVSFDELKLVAGITLLSPYLPMLFMGEEYADTALFNFFTDFSDPALIEAVREGRKREFGALLPPGFEPPDTQGVSTFLASKLNHGLRHEGKHRVLHRFYRELLHLRKTVPALHTPDKALLDAVAYNEEKVLYLHRWKGDNEVVAIFNFNSEAISTQFPIPPGQWVKHLTSSDTCWHENTDETLSESEAEQLYSEGYLEITLQPHALIILIKGL